MRTFFIAMAVAGLLAAPPTGPALAADFERGLAAYEARDYETALAEFTELAERGDASAQFYLGEMYSSSDRGVRYDYDEAMRWWRLAAEQGVADAQFNLGVMYDNGQGVPASA